MIAVRVQRRADDEATRNLSAVRYGSAAIGAYLNLPVARVRALVSRGVLPVYAESGVFPCARAVDLDAFRRENAGCR